ncbi:hypothetical protein C3B54_11149 [Pontimonas salivibrio]|uniref:Uncharacterized protein n=1 Tax=Pontimonas salivibrio TaxID=1159327 RepID=A0A2L2BNA7_9MICO|nr:DUF6049 family protein [Pontimonas salivibrio]AVG23153.1 hypothetical protein C3B54_11149 [Pontimonas salivibrio]
MRISRPPRKTRWARGRVLLVALLVGILGIPHGLSVAQAAAPPSSSDGTVDLFIQDGSVVQPGQVVTVRVTLRAAEAQPIPERAIRLSITAEPLVTEVAMRRFIAREADPSLTTIDVSISPEVLELETGDVRIPFTVPGDPEAEGVPPQLYGLQADLIDDVGDPDAQASLSQRQLLTVVPEDAEVAATPVAPIVTVSVPPAGGQALSVGELEAYTAPGGALDVVAGVLGRYPATIAVDSRITLSIQALGDSAPESARKWADGLSGLGFSQFALPWADSDPLATQAIDTLLYARLGQYPWIHNQEITGPQLEALAQRSAEAVLVPSSLVNSDRTVVQFGSARMVRVDVELSNALREATIAATEVEAEAALQRVQGLVAKRAFSQTDEALVVDTGRLPVTAISLRLENVLERLENVEFVDIVGVPLDKEASELALEINESSPSGEWTSFIADVRELWQSDVRYATIASDPESVVVQRWNRYLALFSSAWMGNPQGRDAQWQRAQEDSAAFHNSVFIEQGSAITVLADRTELPVTIRNDLPSAVTVQLVVSPSRGNLRVEQPTISVVVPAESFRRVSVPVRSLANGTVPVELSLTNSLGLPLGESVTLPVTIRAGWESVITVGLAVIIGLVFAIGIYRAVQRRMAGKELGDG